MSEDDAVDFSDGDSLVVDFNDVEESTFEALPRGSYPCTIAENEFTFSQSGGNPMWTMQLEVAEGEYAGRKLYNHLVFRGAGLGITKANLARIAPELMESPFDPRDEEIIASLLGRNVVAKVTVRDWEGSKRNNVQGLFPGEGDGFV